MHRFIGRWLGAGVGFVLMAAGSAVAVPSLGPEQIIRAGEPAMEINTGDYSVPSLADWDSDGLPDLITCGGPDSSNLGRVRVYINQGPRQVPRFDTFFNAQADGQDLTFVKSGCMVGFPRVVYWDGDGRKDLLIGQGDGTIRLYLNVGTDEAPTFDAGRFLAVGPAGAKSPIDVGARATPVVADWNADGHKDLVVGAVDGRIRVYINEGSDHDPDFAAMQFVGLGEADLVVPSTRSSPIVTDFDGDGLKDLLTGNTNGQVLFYRNVGTAGEPRFEGYGLIESDGVPIDIDSGTVTSVRSRPSLCDWTADGRPDLLVGSYDGRVRLYEGLAAWVDPTEAALAAAGRRLTALQNLDGGWDDPLDDGDPASGTLPGLSGTVGLGLVRTYPFGADVARLEAMERAGASLLSRTDDFVAREGAMAAALDAVFGTTVYSEHVRAAFYDRLAAGTYYDVRTGTAGMTTEAYITSILDCYGTEGVNTAAWDLGVSLVDAHLAGADTAPWIAAVCEQIDRLDAGQADDVLGLAGAVLGLATVGHEYDPQAGAYAAAYHLRDQADALLACQLPSGGFTSHASSMEPGDETVSVTAYAILALAAVDRVGYATPIARARQYLLDTQLPTGGWEAPLGDGERNGVTAEAVCGLAGSLGPPGDVQDDGTVDMSDLAVLSEQWRRAACGMCHGADLNRDGRIDLFDLLRFFDHWMQGQ